MSSFLQKLDQRSKTSLLCIGLDPRPADYKNATAAKDFCIRIIRETSPFAAAFKPNAAFFEEFGGEGWAALHEVIRAVPEEIPVILDAKRGDIADTAQSYARSAFDHFNAGAITVSPYMGAESLSPFLKYTDRAVFILCKTSNPGANELQRLAVGASGRQLFEEVAHLAETKWSKIGGGVGIVVGATDPSALRQARAAAPSLWFLCPGVGAQGGTLAEALPAALRSDGSGVLVNVSRGITGAKNPAAAAQALNTEINVVRKSFTTAGSLAPAVRGPGTALVASALREARCIRFGEFKLKSGTMSPIYLDLRNLVSRPDVLRIAAKAYAAKMNDLQYDRIVGLPYAALPIATAVSLEVGKPLIYPRKETKQYGTKAAIEGEFNKGERVVVIDDLVSDGGTKIEAVDRLKDAGLTIVSIVVLIDREQGAGDLMKKHGLELRSVAKLTELLSAWKDSKVITSEQDAKVRQFMRSAL